MKSKILLICLFFIGVNYAWSQGFYISGNQLRDANGNNFIMKGMNLPLSWFTNDVNNNITNIRNNTGANCMRIVVNINTPDNAWQTAVQNCINNKMIPMVELHDATGSSSASALNSMAQFWASKAWYLTQSGISRYILINIANEWGDWTIGNQNQVAWYNAYTTAISTIRNAGINTTLVIDAPAWGQDLRNGESLRNYANSLQNYDPRKNLLFSVHMYCEWANGGGSSVSSGLPQIKNAGIPIIVGEFGNQHDNGVGGVCDINESQIMSTCQSNGIGWLAWSWKGNASNLAYLDLSSNWSGSSLTSWGNTIVWGANGTKTAATASVFNGGGSGCGSQNGYPICCNASSDPDGDGWGWENNQSCVVSGGSSGGINSGGTYSIIARHSGKALDVAGVSTASGSNVHQWTNYSSANQKWILTSVGSGYYRISPTHATGQALDVSGASTADGANVQTWAYGGGNNQQWQIVSQGNGYYQIKARNSGKCLDVYNVTTADGGNVQQWVCGSGNNQQWSISSTSARLQISDELSDIDTATKLEELTLYPNPSKGGAFKFNLPDYISHSELKIIDMHGKTVHSQTLNQSGEFELKLNLMPGLYLVKVNGQNNSLTKKLVIE